MKERLRLGLVLGWVLLVVLGAAALVAWMLRGSAEERPSRAMVLGALLPVVLLVPPAVVWAWRHRRPELGTSTTEQADAAADLLAARTLVTGSEQLVRQRIELPAPVRVQWRWAGSDVTPSAHDLAASPSLGTDPRSLPSGADNSSGTPPLLSSGLVTQLHDQLYARLRHGRLALIGAPGAGKTAAMNLLLVEALRYRERIPDVMRAEVPVPVWLTLGSWNPRSQGLRDWVTAIMKRDHPYLWAREFGQDAATQLLGAGRVALFLDGLDEMPHTQRGEALERLTSEAAGLRVVITSRPEELRATLDTGRQLPYTAVVELQPVDTQAAVGYLLEGQVGVSRQRWHDVADHLLAHPGGVLARTLNTPLTLSLARFAYTLGNPCELLTPGLSDEHGVRVHLLDQALVAAYPDIDERAHATYWLGWLAHRMNTQPSGPTRDLPWWRIPSWAATQSRLSAERWNWLV
jgi:hypothetical protein